MLTDTFLTKVNLMPNNQIFSFFDSKTIIGKSDPNNKNYDVLVFASRDIEIVKIPSFIRIIGYNALNGCDSIQKVEFSDDSQLEIIQQNAFLNHL